PGTARAVFRPSLSGCVPVGPGRAFPTSPNLAANKQVIGKSEMYTSEAGRDNGIASVMRNCASTKIVEAAPEKAA
ncbi:MAG: hypothetical protein RLZZ124_1537, partial [Cyanobacteriota bacterium]